MGVSSYTMNVGKNDLVMFQEVEKARSYLGKVEQLVLDFNNSLFLSTGRCVIISCIVEHLHMLNPEMKKVAINFSPRLKRYVENIRFNEYWKKNFDKTNYTNPKISTVLCLWQISSNMIDMYSSFAQNYFEKHYEEKSLAPLAIAHKEVFNNIFDHARSPIAGFVITQRYPNVKAIETAICDFGVGIPASLNKFWTSKYGWPLTDREAMEKALERNVTSGSNPRNRGYGLDNLVDQVKGHGGTLNIVSNSQWYSIDETGVEHFDEIPVYFNGTYVVVRFNENNLPETEDDIEVEYSLDF